MPAERKRAREEDDGSTAAGAAAGGGAAAVPSDADMEEVIRKRRERARAWQEAQKAEEEEKEKEEKAGAGEEKAEAKAWSLSDDEDDGEDEARGGGGGGGGADDAASDGSVDPLDAYMLDVEEDLKKEHAGMVEKLVREQKGDGSGSAAGASRGGDAGGDEDGGDGAAGAGVTEDKALGYFELLKQQEERNKKELPLVDHSKITYRDFRKDFYIEPPEIAKLSPEDVVVWRQELDNIQIRGKRCPRPIRNFAQGGLGPLILDVCKKSGFVHPTPIQAQALPLIMSGRDVIGIAKTGSGKTMAFLLPLLRHIQDQPPLATGEGPIGLIMAPTRELAIQIHADARRFAKPLGLRCVCAYGGTSIAEQIAGVKRGTEILVATPGRLVDLLAANKGRVTNLQRVTYVVLDEADRMFDEGFEPQIKRVLQNCRPDKQTVMFSATFPRQVESLARHALKTPVEVVVGGRSVVASDVTLVVDVVEEQEKFRRLLAILHGWNDNDKGSALIFVRRQEHADKLLRDLFQSGHPCLSLHAGKDQADRDDTLADFKNGVAKILVATSLAARGLDIKDLTVVVNYDVPSHYEDFVHRCGRTGRAGRKGTAYTFMTMDDYAIVPDIVKALQLSNTPVPDAVNELLKVYEEKKASGEKMFRSSGFHGQGYAFDASEQSLAKEKREVERMAYGIEAEKGAASGDAAKDGAGDEDDADAVKPVLPPALARAAAARAAAGVPPPGIPPPGMLPPGVNTNVPPPGFPGALPPALAALHSAALPAIEEHDQHYAAEIEINDYPQQARWRVTKKDALNAIVEFTGCAISTRGNYYGPGKQCPANDRKLYLAIEGKNANMVQQARQDIRRMLEEESLKSIQR